MTGGARHVPVFIDGKTQSRASLVKRIGADEDKAFEKNWVATMKKHKLLNAARKQAWYALDGFHLEVDEARPKKGSDMSIECIKEYVRLAGTDKSIQSKPLESDFWAKKQIAKYRKEAGIVIPTADEDAAKKKKK